MTVNARYVFVAVLAGVVVGGAGTGFAESAAAVPGATANQALPSLLNGRLLTVGQVEALGRANGQALACGAKASAEKVRALMLERAPRTAEAGGAYERGTQAGYVQQLHDNQPCPAESDFVAHIAALSDDRDEQPVVNHRFVLNDLEGRAVSNESFPGRFQLISFGYTTCGGVCPTTLASLQRIHSALGADAGKLQVIFITLDPARDTPTKLASYMNYFDHSFVALSAPEDRIRGTAAHFGLRYQLSSPDADGSYTIDHESTLYLLDGNGDYVASFASDAPPAETTARLRNYIDAGSR